MKLYHGLSDFNAHKPVVTIGTFDGVHMGHQLIISRLQEIAKVHGGETVIFTFQTHPRLVTAPNETNLRLLTTLEEKIKLFEKEARKESKQKTKVYNSVRKRFKTLYKNISIDKKAIIGFLDLTEDMKIKSEEIIHKLNENPKIVPIKRKVFSKKSRATVQEVIFAYNGRLYFRASKNSRIEILTIGTKNTQTRDLEYLDGI